LLGKKKGIKNKVWKSRQGPMSKKGEKDRGGKILKGSVKGNTGQMATKKVTGVARDHLQRGRRTDPPLEENRKKKEGKLGWVPVAPETGKRTWARGGVTVD